MKYIRTKEDKLIVLPVSSHHKDYASKSEVKSAGRFTTDAKGNVKTYSKSYGFNVTPKKDDASFIKSKLK